METSPVDRIEGDTRSHQHEAVSVQDGGEPHRQIDLSIGIRAKDGQDIPAAVSLTAINGSSELLGSLALGVVTLLFNRALMDHIGAVGVALAAAAYAAAGAVPECRL